MASHKDNYRLVGASEALCKGPSRGSRIRARSLAARRSGFASNPAFKRTSSPPLNLVVRFAETPYASPHAQGAASARSACASSYALCSAGAIAL